MLDWARNNQKKIALAAIGAALVYFANSPLSDTPEVKAATFFLRGLAAAIGVGG